MIMDRGEKAFYAALGADRGTLKDAGCGYCMIIAKKQEGMNVVR